MNLLFLLAAFTTLGDVEDYIEKMPKGDYRKGEIEIVTDPAQISTIQEKQIERLVKKGWSKEEARESSRTGIVAQDIFWVWLRDAVIFPTGATGTYDRLLWQRSMKQSIGVAVLPILSSGRFVLNLNFRHATRSWEFEIPRGGIHEGETIEQAARRELKEETGLTVRELIPLGTMAADSGVLNTLVPIFAGTFAEEVEKEVEFSEAIAGTRSFSYDELVEGYQKGFIEVEPEGKVYFRDSFLTFALFQYKNLENGKENILPSKCCDRASRD